MTEVKVHSLSIRADRIARVLFSPVEVINLFTNKSEKTHGIWDTGATGSAITESFAKKLGLVPITKANVKGVHGNELVNVYAIRIILNNTNVVFTLKVTECKSLTDNNIAEMLIGMDVITQGDFSITNFEGKTTMSFRVPSIKNIDFVDDLKVTQPYKAPKVPDRNEKCHCGSGKKYKYCHGMGK